jgi:hypothetical protein
MRKGRGAKRAALAVAGALAAVAMVAPTASAAPGCEHMLPPEDCEKYYYGTFQTLGDTVLIPAMQAAYGAVDTAFDVAIWAGQTYDCTVWGRRCE